MTNQSWPATSEPDVDARLAAQSLWLLAGARVCREQNEPIMSTGALLKADGGWEHLLMPFENEAEKGAQAAAFRRRAEQVQALGALYLTDTWPGPTPVDPEDPEGTRFTPPRSPEPRPDRRECLLLVSYTPATIRICHQAYQRGPDGTVTWDPPFSLTHSAETMIDDRFDPFPRPGQAPRPTLEELALRDGIAIAMVQTGRNPDGQTEIRKAVLLTDPTAVAAHHVAAEREKQAFEQVARRMTAPGHEKPWPA